MNMANNKSDKYVRLTEGNAVWHSEKSNLRLSALVDGQSYAKLSELPEASLAAVQKGVDAGLLEYTKSPKDKAKNSTTSRSPLVESSRASFKWTDEEKRGTGKVLKTPSFSSRTMGIDSDSKVDKQAFNVLSQSPKPCTKELSTILSKLDDKADKVEFLKACYTIEKSGANPSMHPRTEVMDFLKDALFNLGVSSGISRISVDEEPLVGNVEPVRFKL